jgi:Zn-dependent peptidase ImmA (M78 family)
MKPATTPSGKHGEEDRLSQPSPSVRIGERLRRARLMAGHSLRSLAEELGHEPSHTQIAKFESGESCPDTKQIARFSRVLKLRPDYFFKKDLLKLETVEYRSQTKLGAKPRKRLEELAYEFFERYLEIERIMELPLPNFRQEDLSKLTPGQLPEAIETAAVKLREQWKLGMNPIPNLHATLEKHGLKVKILPHEDGFDGFSAFAEGEGIRVPVIALSEQWLRGEKPDLPRFRFTAAHELAHLFLKLPEDLTSREKEACCHRFAGAFLIPEQPFKEAFGMNRGKIALAELLAIKAEWGLSQGATMKRACNLGLITEGAYKTYCIVAGKQGWRTKEPGKWIGEEDSHRFQPLVLRALAQGLITPSKAAGLLGVSLPELGELYTPLSEA